MVGAWGSPIWRRHCWRNNHQRPPIAIRARESRHGRAALRMCVRPAGRRAYKLGRAHSNADTRAVSSSRGQRPTCVCVCVCTPFACVCARLCASACVRASAPPLETTRAISCARHNPNRRRQPQQAAPNRPASLAPIHYLPSRHPAHLRPSQSSQTPAPRWRPDSGPDDCANP